MKTEKIMSILSIKKKFPFFILLLFINGCIKIDTNPNPLFKEVQENLANFTDQKIFWDSSMKDCEKNISVEELLKCELTEDLAIQIALSNNQNLQAVYENLGISKANLAQAGVLKNPIFSILYRFSTNSNITDLIDINLFQNFLEIILIPLKKKMAQAQIEATKAILLNKILDVIAETKITFYTLQAAEKIWNLKKEILLATELSYEAAEKLFEVGNIRDFQVSIERSFYEQAKLEVASWEVTVLEIREKLNVLMGLWGNQINWKTSLIASDIPLEEDNFKNIENDAIANSIDLKVAWNTLLATIASYGIDTTKLVFPQLDIGVSSEREDSIWFVGPAFNIAIPIFDFGKINSAKAKAAILQEWNQYIALAVEIRSKARSSRFYLFNAFRQSQYLKKVIVPLAEEITHSIFLQNNAMQLGIFQLLSAKKEELANKIQSIQMHQEYRISKVVFQTLLNGHVLERDPFEASLRKYYE